MPLRQYSHANPTTGLEQTSNSMFGVFRSHNPSPLADGAQRLHVRQRREHPGAVPQAALDVRRRERQRVGAAAGAAAVFGKAVAAGAGEQRFRQRRRVREALQHRIHEAGVAQVLQPRALRTSQC